MAFFYAETFIFSWLNNSLTLLKRILSPILLALTYHLSAQNIDQLLKGEDLLRLNGNFNISTLYRDQPENPFQYFASGQLNLQVIGYNIPLQFSYSNQEVRFQQPFNQLSMQPVIGNTTLHIGFSSLQLSPYSLNGHHFNGIGVESKHGKLDIKAMYGRLQQQIVNGDAGSNQRRSMGYGTALGYQLKNGKAGITVFRATEDLSQDTLFSPPQDNLITTFHLQQNFMGKLMFDGQFALSRFTPDLWSSSLMERNAAGYLSIAYQAQLGYQISPAVNVGLNHEKVAPDYQNLGAYYINNDFVNYTLTSSGSLWSKASYNVNGGVQYNNMEDTEVESTRRWVGSVSLNQVFEKGHSVNISANNFIHFTQYNPTRVMSEVADPTELMDSLSFRQVSRQAAVNTIYNLQRTENKHQTLMAIINYQYVGSIQTDTMTNETNSFFSSVGWNQQWVKEQFNISVSCIWNYIPDGASRTSLIGPGITMSKPFIQNALQTTAGVTWQQDMILQNSLLNIRFQGRYNLGDHIIQLQYVMVKASTRKTRNNLTLSYTYSF